MVKAILCCAAKMTTLRSRFFFWWCVTEYKCLVRFAHAFSSSLPRRHAIFGHTLFCYIIWIFFLGWVFETHLWHSDREHKNWILMFNSSKDNWTLRIEALQKNSVVFLRYACLKSMGIILKTLPPTQLCVAFGCVYFRSNILSID